MNIRILLLLFCLFLLSSSVRADSWDDFNNLDRIWDGQKTITNQEFEQVLDKLEENSNKKEEKQKKKKRKKLFGSGTTLHEELNPDLTINELDALKPKNDGILVNIPVDFVLEGKLLEKGFYNIFAQTDEDTNKKYISFYQSQFFKGKIEVTETQEDYGKETLDFAEILPFN